jgi:hypothetical protein
MQNWPQLPWGKRVTSYTIDDLRSKIATRIGLSMGNETNWDTLLLQRADYSAARQANTQLKGKFRGK